MRDFRPQSRLQVRAGSRIPFEMPRFIDGIDLMSMTLVIHFANPEGLSDHAKPVNVSFSEDKIQFAWLVDEKVTAIAGEVKFEIFKIK